MLDCHRWYVNFLQTRSPFLFKWWSRARVPFSTEFNKARNDYRLLAYIFLTSRRSSDDDDPIVRGKSTLGLAILFYRLIHKVSRFCPALNSHFKHFRSEITSRNPTNKKKVKRNALVENKKLEIYIIVNKSSESTLSPKSKLSWKNSLFQLRLSCDRERNFSSTIFFFLQ